MEGNICTLWVYTQGLKRLGGKNKVFFPFSYLFPRILTDKRFIFVSLSCRRAEIDFDVGFIVRPTNFSLIDTPFLIILYTNIKNYDFLIFFVLYISKAWRGIGHVWRRSETWQFIVIRLEISDLIGHQNIYFCNIKFSQVRTCPITS
jgi:hypothetical protein